MTTQADVEQLLQQVKLATPSDESHASEMLTHFVSIRNAAFEGAGGGLPGTTTALSIPGTLQQLKRGEYPSAAVSLIGMAGDAAAAYSFVVTAGIEAGAFSGVGALAASGVVAEMLGAAAGPATLAATVLIETFSIPADTTENVRKLYFLADASGILTSWVFNIPEINPHARLLHQARTGGFARTDISGTCRTAHERVQHLWRRAYQGRPQARQAARASVGDSWERFWQQIGAAMESRLQPMPRRSGAAWVDNQINLSNGNLRRTARAAAQQAAAARRRQAQGGYWFRTPEGMELFMPDP